MKKILLSLSLVFIGIFSVFFMTGCAESAYEIALRNGYQVTESQWLESLKGSNGQDGEDGVDYEDIKSLYNDLKANGEYSGKFLEFIK